MKHAIEEHAKPEVLLDLFGSGAELIGDLGEELALLRVRAVSEALEQVRHGVEPTLVSPAAKFVMVDG